jgi:uncharacterized protein with gpF-like domain
LKDLAKGAKTLAHVERGLKEGYHEKWADEMAEATEEIRILILDSSAMSGAASVGVVGVSFDVTNPRMQEYVGQTLGLIDDITDTTIKQVEKVISTGIAEGDSIPTIANSIDEYFDGAIKNRATTIARTEVIGASNAGSLEGYIESGVVEGKEWLTAIDGREREWHAAADGQIVGLTESFTVKGESLNAPGDPSASASNIVNCRCAIAPVVDL